LPKILRNQALPEVRNSNIGASALDGRQFAARKETIGTASRTARPDGIFDFSRDGAFKGQSAPPHCRARLPGSASALQLGPIALPTRIDCRL